MSSITILVVALDLVEVAPEVGSRHTSDLSQAHLQGIIYSVLRGQGADLLSLQSWFCCVSVSLHMQVHVESRGHSQVLFLGCYIPLFERRSLPPCCSNMVRQQARLTTYILLHSCTIVPSYMGFTGLCLLGPYPFLFLFLKNSYWKHFLYLNEIFRLSSMHK